MDYNVIDKHLPSGGPRPDLLDYAAECAQFSWMQRARRWSGCEGGALNIAHEAVGRHASGPRATQLALRWLGRAGACANNFTYSDLDLATSRFANVLAGLVLLTAIAYSSWLGAYRSCTLPSSGHLERGRVGPPLFSAFGPEPIATRLTIGQGKALITTASLMRSKWRVSAHRCPSSSMCWWCATSWNRICRSRPST